MDFESKAELVQKFLETKASLEVSRENIPPEARMELLNMERIKTVRTGALANTFKICGVLFLFLALISFLSFNLELLAAGTVLIMVLAVVIFRSWAATCTRCKNHMVPRRTKRGRIRYDFCKRCYTYSKVVRDVEEDSEYSFEYDERLPPS